ncbi:MAG: class I SAM-dependent methyltransferase [bacterium]|nr:class I SAM-dependent methyltransferase [bacterium]
MQILLSLYYFFRSVLLRGLLNTIRLLKAEVTFEKQFGIRTSALKRSASKEFFHYQGASYLVLFKIFKELETETKAYNFVDIGCGKGRVVFVAEYCGYTRLRGIELDEELFLCAKENVALWTPKHKESQIEFVQVNALDAEYRNEPTVYFLFNPFCETVLRGVLNRVCQSSSRGLVFVYMNPLYPKPFYEKKMEVFAEIRTKWYREAIIFHRIAAPNSQD